MKTSKMLSSNGKPIAPLQKRRWMPPTLAQIMIFLRFSFAKRLYLKINLRLRWTWISLSCRRYSCQRPTNGNLTITCLSAAHTMFPLGWWRRIFWPTWPGHLNRRVSPLPASSYLSGQCSVSTWTSMSMRCWLYFISVLKWPSKELNQFFKWSVSTNEKNYL